MDYDIITYICAMHQVLHLCVLFCSSAKAKCVATTITCAAKEKSSKYRRQSCHHKAARVIAEHYGIAKSTLSDIKKNRDKIVCFKQMCDMGMSKKEKVMKLEDDAHHDKGVYLWFKQKRMEGVPEIKMNKNLHANFRSSDTAWMKTRSIPS